MHCNWSSQAVYLLFPIQLVLPVDYFIFPRSWLLLGPFARDLTQTGWNPVSHGSIGELMFTAPLYHWSGKWDSGFTFYLVLYRAVTAHVFQTQTAVSDSSSWNHRYRSSLRRPPLPVPPGGPAPAVRAQARSAVGAVPAERWPPCCAAWPRRAGESRAAPPLGGRRGGGRRARRRPAAWGAAGPWASVSGPRDWAEEGAPPVVPSISGRGGGGASDGPARCSRAGQRGRDRPL